MGPTYILLERSRNHRPTGSVAKRRSPDHPVDDDGDDCAAAAAAMMMMIAAGETSQRHLVPERVYRTKCWPKAVASFQTTETSATAATVAGKERNRPSVVAVASSVEVDAADCSRLQRHHRLDMDAVLGDPPADICSYDTLFCYLFKSKKEMKRKNE